MSASVYMAHHPMTREVVGSTRPVFDAPGPDIVLAHIDNMAIISKRSVPLYAIHPPLTA